MKIGRVLFLCMTLASVAPLWAKESGSNAAISAAFSNKNYNKGLELVRQAFARLEPSQSVEAATLIKSVLASVPIDESGATVVAAIEGNRSLGTAILNAAVSGASRDEQLAILSRLSFALSQHPEKSGSIANHLPGMLSEAERTVPVSVALTSPTYNPANSLSDTNAVTSPVDIRQDKKDIRADRAQLQADRAQLLADRAQLLADKREGKSPAVIAKEEAKIDAEQAKIDRAQKDLKADEKDLRQDE
jgi:hypothetical protein